MHHTLSTLASQHDHRLVLLALSVCVFGAIASIRVLQLALDSTGRRRMAWLGTSALSAGCTIWSTHFIAMLAYDPGVPVGYDLWPTVGSFLTSVLFAAVAFAAMMRKERWAPFVAGALFGYGVAMMHYIGMSAVQVPGRIAWDPGMVAFSVAGGMVFGIFALAAVRLLPRDRGLLSGFVALACSVLFLHIAGMGAATIVHDPLEQVEPGVLPPIVFAAGAAVSTCFVLVVTLVSVMFDTHMTKGRREAEQRIRHLAFHDSLTGLPNRAHLGDVLRTRLDKAAEAGEEVALLAIDLDRFKQVNDIFGHKAGDGLLRTLADSMRAELRDGEILARVGGDEFVVVQSGVAQPAGAESLARRLLDATCRDVSVEGVTFRAAVSIGIALYPRDGRDAATLHPNADAALYRAKEDGRGVYRMFAPEMDLAIRERRALQLEMREALKRGNFKLYYQPQAETMTGVISGFEALIRWDHPRRGLISPAQFIPAAEENGFIVELGEFVLRTACSEAASWSRPLPISVNLSPVQFRHGDLVALVGSVISETGIDPGRLELEITESVLIDDMSRALDMLRRLKSLGVRVAMDDFGTGYSSLAYLQAFPFDRIKIDQSFIAGLEGNSQSEAIIRAVVGLGRGLNVPVTAEGVETASQQQFLAELDCAEIQGYLIGRPQPIENLAMHVGRGSGKSSGKAVA